MNIKTFVVLFCVGALGAISLTTDIFELMPILIGLAVAVWIGAVCSQETDLKSPALEAFSASENVIEAIKPQIIPAFVAATITTLLVLLSRYVFSAHLPEEYLLVKSELTYPWYTKVFFLGVTEVILLQWLFIPFVLWRLTRATRLVEREDIYYISAIALTAIISGLGYFFYLYSLDLFLPATALAYLLVPKVCIAIITGCLFWKYGFECAIVMNMICHAVVIFF